MIRKLYYKMKSTTSEKQTGLKKPEEYPSFFQIILFILFGNR